ncbi:MAG TPA: tetratricopeptide repeat protein [Dongiaceae bacterium]|nr:tetratricopeptide repeat protein [Dongiaceae bacterium]
MAQWHHRWGRICRVLLFGTLYVAFAAAQQSPEELYNAASSAYDRGEVARAISLYEQFLRIRPDSAAARSELGIALVHEGRYAEGIAQYQEALRLDPENSAARLDVAIAWYKQGEFEKAARELETLRRKHSEDRQSLYLLSDCYLRLGRNADVVALLEPSYEVNPEDLALDYALGTALIRQGQIAQSERVIDHILKKGDSAEANLLMGAAQFERGDYKSASTSLRSALNVNPNISEAWSLYGRTLLHIEDREGAKAAFTHALQLDGNDYDANLYMGNLLRTEGKPEQAIAYAERARRSRASAPESRFQTAALDAALGKLDDARKEFEALERDWPDFLEVHVQLASLYARMNLKQESERERDLVLKFNQKARDNMPQRNP